MTSELIVHVGPHKTGTTSIQAALNADFAVLLAHGCYVPETGTAGRTEGHHALSRELNANGRPCDAAGTLRALHAELQPITTPAVLISSESLSEVVAEDRKYARLRELAHSLDRKLVIVAVVRDYLTLVNSLYVHEISGFGHAQSFPKFLAERLAKPSLYTRVLESFVGVSDRMMLLPYTKDVVASFYQALGLPEGPSYQRLNKGAGPKTIELCRALFLHYQWVLEIGDRPASIRKRLIWRTAKQNFGSEPPYWGFGEAVGRQAARRFMAADQALFETLGFTPPPSPRRRQPNDCRYEDMTVSEQNAFRSAVGEVVLMTRARPPLIRKAKGEPTAS